MKKISMTTDDDRLKNRRQALTWLHEQGIQISQGKLYGDAAEGKLVVNPDGSISKWRLMEYARILDQSRQVDFGRAETAAEKDRLELRKLELDVQRREAETRREDERWLLKDDAWAAIAALIGTLLDSLRHHFHAGQGQLIHLAGGDPVRGPELFEGCEELINKAFNEAAAARIEGIFEMEAEDV